jgi:hypothetical protein
VVTPPPTDASPTDPPADLTPLGLTLGWIAFMFIATVGITAAITRRANR